MRIVVSIPAPACRVIVSRALLSREGLEAGLRDVEDHVLTTCRIEEDEWGYEVSGALFFSSPTEHERRWGRRRLARHVWGVLRRASVPALDSSRDAPVGH